MRRTPELTESWKDEFDDWICVFVTSDRDVGFGMVDLVFAMIDLVFDVHEEDPRAE